MYNYCLSTFQRLHPDDIVVKDYGEYRITRNEYEIHKNLKVKVFFVEQKIAWRPFYFLFLFKRSRWQKLEQEYDSIVLAGGSKLYKTYSNYFIQPLQFSNFTTAAEFIYNHG